MAKTVLIDRAWFSGMETALPEASLVRTISRLFTRLTRAIR